MTTPDFSVVICAYTDKRWNDLIEAVESLQRQAVPPREVIVVIDHNPAVFERAKATFSGVTVTENHHERGLSGARNTGVDLSSGEIVAFLDDDAVAEPDWLYHLGASYADARVMGVMSEIKLTWLGEEPRWFPEEFFWTVGGTYRGMPERLAPVRNLMGAAMSLRRELLQGERFRSAMGRTDAVKLPLGCEETELCIRLRQSHTGGQFMYEPRSRVYHKVPASRATWRYFWQRCYAEGLSKAHVTQLVGGQDGLSTERSYTLKVLPSGVLRGLAGALRGDASGLGRAAAIVSGLFVTAAGYLMGKRALGREQPAPTVSPARS